MKKRGFTLVEIMIVVLIIGVLMSVAVPQFLQSREVSRHRTCLSNLKKIDEAKEMRAGELSLNNGDPCDMNDITPTYLRRAPSCPANGTYTVNVIGTDPTCSQVGGIYPHVLP
ncbi:MAG: prepilin-type N-terminal cleavage/methylation domain-containing protein [Methanoregulaceae archaeon]|jgi:prepilin-type N-terminal cleavage/methylation domain-containing protein|nr:prepilin-type N-terminal cleavage/methylation domain-containing protein [Methanoregulaceae archaeon]